MSNRSSGHILNSSANLLGFRLVVLTGLHISDKTENHNLKMLSMGITFLHTISSMFSFASLRSINYPVYGKYESIAEYIFFMALAGILILLTFIFYTLIK